MPLEGGGSSNITRHSSISNVTSADSCSSSSSKHHQLHHVENKPIGTLQRLARSSSNLISRSKSCLTLESLQRFRKTFLLRSDKGSEVSALEERHLGGKKRKVRSSTYDDLSPDFHSSTGGDGVNHYDSTARLNSSQCSSLDSAADGSDLPNRLGSPTEEPATTSSNLTLSSISRIDPILPDKIVSNGNLSTNQTHINIPHYGDPPDLSSLPNTPIIPSLQNDISEENRTLKPTQRSKSFYDDTRKKTIKRNPSMLYYFNKTPLKLKFNRENRKNNGDSILKDIEYENILNQSSKSCTKGASNIKLSYSLEFGKPSAADCNISENVQNSSSSDNMRFRGTESQRFVHSLQSKSQEDIVTTAKYDLNLCDPSQFHGPEFVLRSQEPPKMLTVKDKSHLVRIKY